MSIVGVVVVVGEGDLLAPVAGGGGGGDVDVGVVVREVGSGARGGIPPAAEGDSDLDDRGVVFLLVFSLLSLTKLGFLFGDESRGEVVAEGEEMAAEEAPAEEAVAEEAPAEAAEETAADA